MSSRGRGRDSGTISSWFFLRVLVSSVSRSFVGKDESSFVLFCASILAGDSTIIVRKLGRVGG